MPGIQLIQTGGAGVVNSAGVQNPAPISTVLTGILCQLSVVGTTPSSYLWTLGVPKDSKTELNTTNGSAPQFTPDKPGNYTIILVDQAAVVYSLSLAVQSVAITAAFGPLRPAYVPSTAVAAPTAGQVIFSDAANNGALSFKSPAGTVTQLLQAPLVSTNLQWDTGVAGSLSGLDYSVAGGTAPSLTIKAPNATGTGSTTGGTLVLEAGSGFVTGQVQLKIAGNLRASLIDNVLEFQKGNPFTLRVEPTVADEHGRDLILEGQAVNFPGGTRNGGGVVIRSRRGVGAIDSFGVRIREENFDIIQFYSEGVSPQVTCGPDPTTSQFSFRAPFASIFQMRADVGNIYLDSIGKILLRAAQSTVGDRISAIAGPNGLRVANDSTAPTERLEVAGNILFDKSISAPILKHGALTTDIAATALNITPQQAVGPNNKKSGDVVVNLFAPVSGAVETDEDALIVKHAGNNLLAFRRFSAFYGAIFAKGAIASPTATNYTLLTDGATVSILNVPSGGSVGLAVDNGIKIAANATGIGVFGATPVAKPTVTGSRGGNAALASLLTAMANLGWVTDSTTA